MTALLALCLLAVFVAPLFLHVPGVVTALGASGDPGHVVRFWLKDELVAQYSSVASGSTISKPTIKESDLRIRGGKRTIVSWHTGKETSSNNEWNFKADRITTDTDLYASWKTTYTSSTNRTTQDPEDYPTIKAATANLNGSYVSLAVQVDGNESLFTYQWQVLNDRDLWVAIPDGNTPRTTLSGVQSDRSYVFRVLVTRQSDSRTAYSDRIYASRTQITNEAVEAAIPVTPATATGGLSTGGSAAAPLLPVVQNSGDLSLTLSTPGPLYVGGRLEAIPGVSGGQWSWDEEMFHSIFAEDAVFTAQKPGNTTLSYSLGGETISLDVEILPATLPATGQSTTLVTALACVGIALIGAALILWRPRSKREVRDV